MKIILEGCGDQAQPRKFAHPWRFRDPFTFQQYRYPYTAEGHKRWQADYAKLRRSNRDLDSLSDAYLMGLVGQALDFLLLFTNLSNDEALIRAIAVCVRRHLHEYHEPKGWDSEFAPYRKGSIPATLRQSVLERDGYRCVKCGATEDLQCDHIVPEVLGGPTTLGNLQTLCRSDNLRKGTKSE